MPIHAWIITIVKCTFFSDFRSWQKTAWQCMWTPSCTTRWIHTKMCVPYYVRHIMYTIKSTIFTKRWLVRLWKLFTNHKGWWLWIMCMIKTRILMILWEVQLTKAISFISNLNNLLMKILEPLQWTTHIEFAVNLNQKRFLIDKLI